jgi:hypothetical protein
MGSCRRVAAARTRRVLPLVEDSLLEQGKEVPRADHACGKPVARQFDEPALDTLRQSFELLLVEVRGVDLRSALLEGPTGQDRA